MSGNPIPQMDFQAPRITYVIDNNKNYLYKPFDISLNNWLFLNGCKSLILRFKNLKTL